MDIDTVLYELDIERADPIGIAFANTRTLHRGEPIDLLASAARFGWWLAQVAPLTRLDVPRDLPQQRILMEEARRLRVAVVDLFEAVAERASLEPATVFTLDRALRAGHRTARLVHGEGVARDLSLTVTYAGEGPVALLAPVAWSACEVAIEADPDRLRRCAGEGCSEWFLDTSKAGRRRWCSMARCGNRAKAARFRRRG